MLGMTKMDTGKPETQEAFSIFPKIGGDEVGKGDFFGPLVVCAVYLEGPDSVPREVRDSKSVSEHRIRTQAPALLQALSRAHAVVKISPAKYNELYAKFKNINAILGWAHARAVKNLLETGLDPRVILIDRFGPEFRVTRHFDDPGWVEKMVFLPRAEEDPAVAVASVIARYTFLKEMERLSRSAAMNLPLGAGEGVDAAARVLAKRVGPSGMAAFAKVHFKNFQRI